ncbi:MAG: hypothetical protein PHV30_04430 [Candidatus Margulisbacteria bacterium]|nr:hypothetical protein [Candidatus Margulisiibacteriota bacterium]
MKYKVIAMSNNEAGNIAKPLLKALLTFAYIYGTTMLCTADIDVTTKLLCGMIIGILFGLIMVRW